jgi:hypothetical protein
MQLRAERVQPIRLRIHEQLPQARLRLAAPARRLPKAHPRGWHGAADALPDLLPGAWHISATAVPSCCSPFDEGMELTLWMLVIV